MNYPKVTVLMPVYNAEKYVGEAIESILNQTFRDFEFLIINDGSTDSSLDVVQYYKDPRIKLVNNEKNLGLSNTLNKGIDLAQGEYLARMDADDISLRERLKKQVGFMDSHPDIGICGSWIQIFDELGNRNIGYYPPSHDELLCSLFYNSCFAHPTVMIRRQIIEESYMRFDGTYCPAEDYYFWLNLLKITNGANLQEILLRYRLSKTQMTSKAAEVIFYANKTRFKILNDLGIKLNDEQKELHSIILNETWIKSIDFFKKVINWLEIISEANQAQRKLPEPLFTQTLSKFLFYRSLLHESSTLNTYNLYKKSKLSSFYKPKLYDVLKLRIKGWIKFW